MSGFSLYRVVHQAHAVRTFNREYLINLDNGTAYLSSARSIVLMDDYFNEIRTVYDNNHQVIAKRKKLGDRLVEVHRYLTRSSP